MSKGWTFEVRGPGVHTVIALGPPSRAMVLLESIASFDDPLGTKEVHVSIRRTVRFKDQAAIDEAVREFVGFANSEALKWLSREAEAGNITVVGEDE